MFAGHERRNRMHILHISSLWPVNALSFMSDGNLDSLLVDEVGAWSP